MRGVIRDIGYTRPKWVSTARPAASSTPSASSPPTSPRASTARNPRTQGAGDQGLMFGYASNETDVLMPAPINYAHRLVERQAKCARADPPALAAPRREEPGDVRLRGRHRSASTPSSSRRSTRRRSGRRCSTRPSWRRSSSRCCRRRGSASARSIHINPTGRFVIGGPMGDCGLTGRKIIVDTYGGMARHGGGAFSGKDPSKVDRSAAYAARYVAKNIVAAGLADRCEIQLSYAIGVAEPTSISVETFGTGRLRDARLKSLVAAHFDLRPYGIIKMLDLLRPIYHATAAYGHFGREPVEIDYDWQDDSFGGGARRQASSRISPGNAPTAPRPCARPPASKVDCPPLCLRRRTVPAIPESLHRRGLPGSGIANVNGALARKETIEHEPRSIENRGLQGRGHRPPTGGAKSPSPRPKCRASWRCGRNTAEEAAGGRAHRGLAAHDDADGGADRDACRVGRRGALGILQHLLDPGSCRRRHRSGGHSRVRVERRDARGVLGVRAPHLRVARRRHANMMLDDGGDDLLLTLGMQRAGSVDIAKPRRGGDGALRLDHASASKRSPAGTRRASPRSVVSPRRRRPA